MALADALKRAQENKPRGNRCRVCLLLEEGLPPEEVADLEAALSDRGFSHAAIARALKAEGHDVGYFTVGRHRNQQCQG